jgi:N-acetylglutamate synthase-like GNAT family acetyltransferase
MAVKRLILAGLAEHWGKLDSNLNPDLNDISISYADAIFLVAWFNNRIIGTGALIPRSNQVAEIVRMSVVADMRRHGVGTKILDRLCREANTLEFQSLILETNATWHKVIAFYQAFGFRITHHQEGKFGGVVHFSLELTV